MAQHPNNQSNECKCDGGKKIKALEKQVAELTHKIETLERKIETFRKVLTR